MNSNLTLENYIISMKRYKFLTFVHSSKLKNTQLTFVIVFVIVLWMIRKASSMITQIGEQFIELGAWWT